MSTFPAVNADRAAEMKRNLGKMGRQPIAAKTLNDASPPNFANDILKGNNAAIGHTEKQERPMGTPSREEIDAKLSQSKTEAEVIAANMKAENAYHREVLMNRLSAMDSSLSGIQQQAAITNGEIIGMKGQLDGMKSSISTTQWMVGTILAMLAIIITIPQIQSYFKATDAVVAQPQADKNPTAQQGK